MDSKIYSLAITGASATFTVTNLTMNGNNYVSEKEIDTSEWPPIFELTVKDGEGNITEKYPHAKLLQQEQYDWDGGKWYLAFAPVNEQEIVNAEQRANLEYLAMMAGVDLDD